MDTVDYNDDNALEELRNQCRDEKEAIKAVKNIDGLLPLAVSGRVKALQVLCNICYHVPSARETAYKHSKDFVAILQDGNDDEQLALTCRLLFFATIGTGADSNTELQTACMNLLEKSEQVQLFALRILYNIVQSWESDTEIDKLSSVVVNDCNTVKVRGAAVNLLVKVDGKVLDSKLSADQLERMFVDVLTCNDKTVIQDYLPSFCQLTRLIVNVNDQKRHQLRSKLLKNTELLKHLKSPYHELVLASGDLIMSLVRNDPTRFIHAVGGYGHAAGYFYMRRIEKPTTKPDYSGTLSSDEEYLLEHGLTDKSLPPTTDDVGMTEEEKEREAERLLDLFDRLEKTGVVKVLRKD